jgi:phosphatidylglycerophosphate synthase
VIDAALRPHKERLLAPLARRLGGSVHPSSVTVAAALVGLAAAGAAAAGLAALAVGAWIANRALDGMDGVIAREDRSASARGGYLDMLLDVVVYAAIPLGIALGQGTAVAWAAAAVLLGSFYVNAISWAYLSALLEARGEGARARGEMTAVSMPRGLVEGAETFVFFAVALAVPAWSVPAMWIMAAAVGAGAAQRALWGMRRLGGA